MKPKSTLQSILFGCGSLLIASSLQAANLYWDATPGTPDGVSDGGAGTWDTTTGNWDDGAAYQIWNNANGDTAVFGGTAGAITLGADVTAGGLLFSSNGYSVDPGTGTTLTLTGTGVVEVTTGTTTINSVIAGSVGLAKTGAGQLAPRGANTFTGGVDLSAGTISITDNVNEQSFLGDAANVLTFSGNAELNNAGNAVNLPQGITINGGVTGIVSGAFGEKTYVEGVLAGSGTLVVQGNSAGFRAEFRNTANTFTGPIEINSGDSVSVGFASLLDSPGATTIALDSQSNNGAVFEYMSSATAPLVFNNRQFELAINGNSGTNLGRQPGIRNNAPTANTMTINTDLLITGTGTKKLFLEGGNTGDNTFAGAIPDGVSGDDLTIYKNGGGKWILTGANTYEGDTIIQNGTLEIRGAGQLGSGGTYPGNITNTDTSPSDFTFDSSADTTISGVISGSMALIKDGVGILSLTGSNSYTGDTTVDAGTLSLGDGTNNSNLDDFATLSVATGAVLDLNYTGSDSVFFLNLGGSPAAAGTWGATGSGATNIDDTYFTGTGVINNVDGVTTSYNISYWDGGAIDIVTDGDASSDGGAGTWDTTTQNWDIGFTGHSAWLNTTSDEAIFGGSAGTVTVAEPVNLGDMTFDVTGNYTIDGSTLNFGAGATIRTADNRYWQTITSVITGSPDVETTDFGAGNQYKGFIFAPATGSQTLGAVLNPNNTGNVDKAGVEFAGSTTGNSAASVDYAGGDRYADTVLRSGEWSIPGGIHTGTIKGFGGTFTLGGTVQNDYAGFRIGGGIIKGDFTLFCNDRRESPFFAGGSTIAPGSSIGTITIDYGTGGGNPNPVVNTQTNPAGGANGDYSFNLMAGSTYEWEIGAGNTTDTIHILEGALFLDDITLKVVDIGGTPAAIDELPVFTYDPAGNKIDMPNDATLLAEVTIDISGTSYTGTPVLENDGAGTIYLTGLSSGGGPGPVDHFVISAIGSPQVVGTAITGITITAQDASNATATGFTGTVDFSGTGGFTGTSASFTAGELTGVSVTPTVAGSGLTLVVTDSVGPSTGSTSITTILTLYEDWSGGAGFEVDTNGDGVDNGMAFLLGAADVNADATGLLPTVTESGGDLILTFDVLNAANRGASTLAVQHSSDLGAVDTWLGATLPTDANDVSFAITPGSPTDTVVATIDSAAAAAGKLFGRLEATE